MLLALAVLALTAATLERHHRDEVPLALSAVVVGLVAVVHLGRTGHLPSLSGALAVLGAALFGYAVRYRARAGAGRRLRGAARRRLAGRRARRRAVP